MAPVSAREAWAVGFDTLRGASQTLILHWNGSAWKQVRSPNPGGPGHDNSLLGARATSASNAWAVGSYVSGTAQRTLVLHWNGSAWKQVKTPNPSATNNSLAGIAATSPTSAWAVGSYVSGSARRTLVLHWNGSVWEQVKTPNPGSGSSLAGIGATSANNIWAVGSFFNGTAEQTLALHCC